MGWGEAVIHRGRQIAEGRLQILKLGVRELSCDGRDAFFNLQSAICLLQSPHSPFELILMIGMIISSRLMPPCWKVLR
jgi:hypothetical protein